MIPSLTPILENFGHLLVDAIPWFIGAVLIASFITSRMHWNWLRKLVEQAGSSVPTAALAGALLPGCAVTTIPLAWMLKQNGAKVGTLTAFIVTSALLGPTSILLTLSLLDWQFSAARIILPFLAVIPLGLILNQTKLGAPPSTAPTPSPIPPNHSCCTQNSHCESHHSHSQQPSFTRETTNTLRRLLPLLLLGLLAVATARYFIPDETILPWLQGGPLAHLGAALIGIPLYVCEGGEVIFTRALLDLGTGPGPAFTFLQASVGTCLPTILLAPRIIGKSTTAIYTLFWFAFAILSGMLVGAWI